MSSTSTAAQSLCNPGASSPSVLFNQVRFMLEVVKYWAFTCTAAECYCSLAATVAFVPFNRGAFYRRRFNAGFYIYCRALRAFYLW